MASKPKEVDAIRLLLVADQNLSDCADRLEEVFGWEWDDEGYMGPAVECWKVRYGLWKLVDDLVHTTLDEIAEDLPRSVVDPLHSTETGGTSGDNIVEGDAEVPPEES